ncbi:DUF202 domain-containing protein [Isoptericola halotolerans]|uniref:DUF202 domain-containing protein n=1 Tax=Isoptericola halotolerans TaxID=300560 RepID=UPI00388EFE02
MTVPDAPYGPGLQPERTLLAWRRTCLAFGVAVAVAVRFAGGVLGPWIAVLGAVGLATVVAAYLVGARRYRDVHRRLAAGGRLPVDGAALGLLTATGWIVGVASAVFVAGVWWR